MRLSRVIYRESLAGLRTAVDATAERPLTLEDGVVWIGWRADGTTGIPLSRCLELVADVPEPLPTAADTLRRPASTIMPADASNRTEGWRWPWRWRA